MASTTQCMSTSLIDGKAPLRQSAAAASSQCVSLPSLPPPSLLQQSRVWKATGYCRKLVRNVTAMVTTEEAPTEVESPDVQELIKPITEAQYLNQDCMNLIHGMLKEIESGKVWINIRAAVVPLAADEAVRSGKPKLKQLQVLVLFLHQVLYILIYQQ